MQGLVVIVMADITKDKKKYILYKNRVIANIPA